MERKYRILRDATPEEFPWLSKTYKKGDIVYHFYGATYGCISPSGIACSIDGDNPFFEIPRALLELVDG